METITFMRTVDVKLFDSTACSDTVFLLPNETSFALFSTQKVFPTLTISMSGKGILKQQPFTADDLEKEFPIDSFTSVRLLKSDGMLMDPLHFQLRVR